MKMSTLAGIVAAVVLAGAMGFGADAAGDGGSAKSGARQEKQAEKQAAKAELQAEKQADQQANGGKQKGAGKGKDANGDGIPDNLEAKQKKGSGAKDTPSDQREKYVDAREKRQQHRIDQGIKQGQLTPDEVSKLEKQEDAIKDMQKKFEADGKLSKDEGKQLKQALDDASLQIWGQRHDTEGNQMAALRLGKDVFAKDDLTAKIESGQMTRAEARQFLGDFQKLTNMKRRLNSGTLNSDERAKLQAEYNDLLNQYFEIRG